ncbi:MAG: 4Fe-4S binding protein [Eubacteriales bacterium]
MKINKIKAIYFSGTGTTAKAVSSFAQTMAELLDVPCDIICINPPAVRKVEIAFSETDLAIIGCPTYAGRLPNLLLPYFQTKLKGNNTLAVPICLYGNRSVDDALMELRNTLQENGFCTIGAAAVVGQHVFAPRLGIQRPTAGDGKMLKTLADRVYEKIDELEAPPELPVDVVGNDPVGPYYVPQDRYGYPINIVKVRPRTDKTKCNKCGICIRTCPMGAISPDPNQVPGPCIKCGFCFKICPTKAKYYDDEGMLYHKKELEAQYFEPKQTQIFY